MKRTCPEASSKASDQVHLPPTLVQSNAAAVTMARLDTTGRGCNPEFRDPHLNVQHESVWKSGMGTRKLKNGTGTGTGSGSALLRAQEGNDLGRVAVELRTQPPDARVCGAKTTWRTLLSPARSKTFAFQAELL